VPLFITANYLNDVSKQMINLTKLTKIRT